MLAAIHKVDMGCTQETVYVTEEDMRIVVDMAGVLIRHTCQASVSIRKRRASTFNNLTPIFSGDTFYGYLSDEFTTSVFLDTVAKHGKWSRSKGMEMLKVWTEKGYIQKVA